MKITDLDIGTKFEIEAFNNLGETALPPFPTKLEAILSENRVVVNAPMFQGNFFPVHIGWKVKGYFIHKKNLYFFPGIIVGRSKEDEIPFMEIEITGSITRIQRRHFFRLNISLPVKYRGYDPLLKKDDEQHKYIETTTIDISGGGISMLTDEKLEFDSFVECKMDLSDNNEIHFIGKVVRSEKLYELNPDKYITAIKFSTIENKTKEKLIRFIYSEQTKLIRKGLLTND